MRTRRRRATSWRLGVVGASALAIALVGVAATPALAVPRTTGTGTASVAPMSVVTPTSTTLHITYVAAVQLTDGVVSVTVPTGWTTPATSNTTASTGSLSVSGSTITVSAVTLAAGASLTVSYGVPTAPVAPPATGGFDPFVVAMSPVSSGTPTPISSSPSVFVYALAPKTLFDEVSSVPLALFDMIGIGTKQTGLTPPTILAHQRPLVTRVDGATVPRSFFYGAEWCPFCMPASWGIVVALARFGHFNQLYEMESSPQDFAPSTPGFTFHLASYTSRYLTFNGFEDEGPFPGEILNPPTRAFQRLVDRYDPQLEYPFMDVGNLAFSTGAPFEPLDLAGLTQSQIGADLTTPSNRVTQAIVGWANYLSAGICASDHERPGTVCRSSGVLRADAALRLPRP